MKFVEIVENIQKLEENVLNATRGRCEECIA